MTIFANCDEDFLKNLSQKVKVTTFKRNQIIFKQGDQSQEIYFVLEGKVEIVSENLQTVFDTIEMGDFFGEIGVLKGVPRNATTRATIDNTVVITISGDEIKNSLERFPASYKAIVLSCNERTLKADVRKEMFASSEELTTVSGLEQMAPISLEMLKEPQILGNIYFENKRAVQYESSAVDIFDISRRSFSTTEHSTTGLGLYIIINTKHRELAWQRISMI
jgi:CRP-like cAMP-binding protein